MAEALGDRLVTTSVGFGDRQHNELEAAALTAEHFNSRHYAEIIEPELDEVMTPVVEGLGEPMADSSAIPTWYVSRAARQHVTVALSGDGGDESFAGYDFRYVPHALEGRGAAMDAGIAGAGGRLRSGGAWPRSPRLPRPLRAGTLLENLGRDPAAAYYTDLTFLKPAQTRALLGLDPRCPAGGEPGLCRGHGRVPPLPLGRSGAEGRVCGSEGLSAERSAGEGRSHEHGAQPGGALSAAGSAGRGAGVPIPASRKQVGAQGKALLRRLAKRRLPAGIWQLPKRGFTVPIGGWIGGQLRGRLPEPGAGARIMRSRHRSTYTECMAGWPESRLYRRPKLCSLGPLVFRALASLMCAATGIAWSGRPSVPASSS